MESDVFIQKVEEVETRTGKTRYVVRDGDGREYTTFRPAIGREAAQYEGRRAHIAFHEEERNGFQNVYLDGISAAPDDAPATGGGESTDPDEVAWNTAVEAAPWMLGTREPDQEIPPEVLFEKLEPFKRLVADDIHDGKRAHAHEIVQKLEAHLGVRSKPVENGHRFELDENDPERNASDLSGAL